MNDILQGLIYYLKNNTHVSIIYLDELLDDLEREHISVLQTALLTKGYIKALYDLGAIEHEGVSTEFGPYRAVSTFV